jgi:hypothetical protein
VGVWGVGGGGGGGGGGVGGVGGGGGGWPRFGGGWWWWWWWRWWCPFRCFAQPEGLHHFAVCASKPRAVLGLANSIPTALHPPRLLITISPLRSDLICARCCYCLALGRRWFLRVTNQRRCHLLTAWPLVAVGHGPSACSASMFLQCDCLLNKRPMHLMVVTWLSAFMRWCRGLRARQQVRADAPWALCHGVASVLGIGAHCGRRLLGYGPTGCWVLEEQRWPSTSRSSSPSSSTAQSRGRSPRSTATSCEGPAVSA